MIQMHNIHMLGDYPGAIQTVFPDGGPQEVDILGRTLRWTNMGVLSMRLAPGITPLSLRTLGLQIVGR